MNLDFLEDYAEDTTEFKIDWQPREGPQTTAYWSEADEIYFGGVAGSGKSDLLIGAALTQHKKSIIFRREYPQLKGIIDRSIQIVGGSDRFNKSEKTWNLGERQLEFGAVQREESVEKFQGRDHDFIGFDELVHFSYQQYVFLTGWNRTSDPNQRCRIVCASNPPTSSQGRWVLEPYAWGAWLDPKYTEKTGNPKAEPGEVRYFVTDPDGNCIEVPDKNPVEIKGELLEPKSRTFIPGKMLDELVAAGYRGRLQALPEPLRSILLKGDFGAGVVDDPWQLIPTAWVEAAVLRWNAYPPCPQTHLGVDPSRGGQDETVVVPRHHNWVGELIVRPGALIPDGDTCADLVVKTKGNPNVLIQLDVVGVGASAYDVINKRGHKIVALNGGAASDCQDATKLLGFFNKRSEWYWNLRCRFDPKNENAIAIPNDPQLISELTMPKWGITNNRGEIGQIRVESKKDIKKRLNGKSPDRADALSYAFADEHGDEGSWLKKLVSSR